MIRLIFFIILIPYVLVADDYKVESFIEEAKGHNKNINIYVNEENTKQILTDYGKPAKEVHYKEIDLKKKADELMNTSQLKAEDKGLSGAERGEAQAIESLKESYKTQKNFESFTSEEWIKTSDLITENPLISVGGICKVSDNKDETAEVRLEPYEIEINDVREVENEEVCEQDVTEIHKCTQKLLLTCELKSSNVNIFNSLINLKNVNSQYRKFYLYSGGNGFMGAAGSGYSGWYNFEDNKEINEANFQIGNFNSKNINTEKVKLIYRGERANQHYLTSEAQHNILLNISQYENLESLKITKVFFDGDLKILVNGNQVFKEEKKNVNEWQEKLFNPDIEIKHFLINGDNSIVIESNTRMIGYAGIQFSGSSNFCSSWKEFWEENCD